MKVIRNRYFKNTPKNLLSVKPKLAHLLSFKFVKHSPSHGKQPQIMAITNWSLKIQQNGITHFLTSNFFSAPLNFLVTTGYHSFVL